MIKPPQIAVTSSIGEYDLFELMNLSKMPQSQKDTYLLDANALIWQGFLMEKLPHLLTQQQYQQLQQQLNDGKTLEEILAWLLELVPNFTYLLAEFTRDAKATLVEKQFQSEILSLEKMLSTELTEQNYQKIKISLSNYKTALRLAVQQEWRQIIELWQASII